MKFTDLHLHSNYSDGELSPEKIVKLAVQNNYSAISITDHDTVEGLEEGAAAAEAEKIEFITGVEISTMIGYSEVHILGYCFDDKNNNLLKILDDMKNARSERIRAIIKKLQKNKYSIELDRVMEISESGVLGRPHIARALIEKGYARNLKEAFGKFLTPGCTTYVPRRKILPRDAIQIILEAKGIPVLAHPGINYSENYLSTLISFGLLGLEVFHPDHSQRQQNFYLQVAKENNLLVTGGSDWHGSNKGKSTFPGQILLNYEYYIDLIKKKGELF